jgi:outer membrane protein TolC
MGTKYNATGAVELTQKLFDASFWIGLKAAKLSESRSELSIRDAEENSYFNVCLAYYSALVIQKQLENMHTVLGASKRTLESAELRLANGMVKRTDVDRIRVSYNVINSHVQQIEMNYKQSLNRLKFQMGMPVDNAITLSDSLPDIGNWEMASADEHAAFPENRVDMLLRKVDLDLYEADKSNNIAAYFPKLSLYANYSYMSYTKSFDGLTKSENWYPFSAVGLQLKIPIFSGFSRLFKVDQSSLAVEKAKENVRLTEQAIRVEVSNCDIQYKTALNNIVNERDNLLLADRVYKDTQQRYAEGTMSALDLVQSESSLRETQNNYFSRLLDLYTAKLNSEKANGTMLTFINNLK